MHNQTETDPSLDTSLATFTDDLISGSSSGHALSQPGNEDLEEIVRQLHMEIRLADPGTDMRSRIHSNLVHHWNQSRLDKSSNGVLQRWWQSMSGDSWRSRQQSQRLSAFALAGVAVIALIFAAVTNIDTLQSLPASATGDISFGAAAITLGFILAAAVLFLLRRRR
jgi:uncharacterized protein (TIGR03382 family)